MKNLKENLIALLALIGIFAPLTMLGILIYKGVEPTALVAGFIGMILGSYPMIFQYYFGSSSGSKNKQETIDKMAASVAPAEDEAFFKDKFAKSGSPLIYDEWLKAQRKAHADSGTTTSFSEWLKTQP